MKVKMRQKNKMKSKMLMLKKQADLVQWAH